MTLQVYYIDGFRANVSESDFWWACKVLHVLQTWPNKTREIYRCIEKCGGFLLLSKPKECFGELTCDLCVNCYSKMDRENVHEFLSALYKIGVDYRLEKQHQVSHSLLRFMSYHCTDLFKPHKNAPRLYEPMI